MYKSNEGQIRKLNFIALGVMIMYVFDEEICSEVRIFEVYVCSLIFN